MMGMRIKRLIRIMVRLVAVTVVLMVVLAIFMWRGLATWDPVGPYVLDDHDVQVFGAFLDRHAQGTGNAASSQELDDLQLLMLSYDVEQFRNAAIMAPDAKSIAALPEVMPGALENALIGEIAADLPIYWPYVMAGTFTILGNSLGDEPVVAFYNPYFDVALITRWAFKDQDEIETDAMIGFKLIEAVPVTGLAFSQRRPTQQAEQPLWADSTELFEFRLVEGAQQFAAAFEEQYPPFERNRVSRLPGDNDAARQVAVSVVENRVVQLLAWVIEAQNPYAPVNYAFVIEDLRDALAESSPDDLDKLLPPDNPQTAQQFFDISPEIRAGMRPYLAIGENVIFIDPINLPTGFISTYVQQDDNDYSLALAMFVSLEADYDGSENVDSTDAAAIEQAVAAASERIAALATSRPDALAGVLQQSFGSRLSPDTRTEFVNLAAARQLPVAERTLFASAEVLAGANGAYASDYGGLILLNDSYRSDAAALPDVVLHEWAHHLDATLDSGDAPGEEGQIFLEGINNGGPIATEDYRRLLASDAGHATLQFEGRTLDVEQWFGSKLWKKAKKFVQKKLPFVAKVVNVVANGAASLAKTVGKTVYAGAQICAAGLAAASGDTAGANAFLNGAANSFKSVAMNALDYVSVAGDLINLTTAAVDSLTPIPFGTIVSVAASFSPIGPYLAANKGIADVKNAIKHKGNVLSAVGFAALDITGSGLSRLGKGLKVARVARAANDANRAGTVAANLTKWQKLKALPGKAKTWLLDTNPLVKARGWEITRGAQFYGETTYKWVDRLKKLNLVVRPKDFIRGRDRNEDGELLGTGGNLWTRHIELCGDYLACARRNKDNKNSNSNASLPQDSPEGDWLIYRNAVINCLPSGCLDSGPDCDTEAVPGQCSFPKNDAARLCEAHGTCLAVTCSDQRNDCQARRATTTESHDDFTSYLLSEDARERASMLQAVRDAGSAVAIQDNETANITEKSNASKAAADVAAKQEADDAAADLAAKQQADNAAADLAAKQQADKAAADLAARMKADKEAADLAAQQEADRQAALLAAKQQADKEAADLAAKQEADRQAALLAAQQQAARDAAARAAQQEADRQAAAALRAAQQQAAQNAAIQAAQQEADRQAAAALLAAQQQAERDAAALAAQQQAERNAAALAAQQQAERDAAALAAQQQAERDAAALAQQQNDQNAAAQAAQPQMTLAAEASGEYNSVPANFELWAAGNEPGAIRIYVNDATLELYFDAVQQVVDELSGQLTPCSIGVCPCTFFREGSDYYRGSCDTGDPNNLSGFSFRTRPQ